MNNSFVTSFREAAPYIHYLHGKTIVLAMSSHIINEEHFPSLARDIALLNSLGIRIVLVHGVRHFLEKKGLSKNYQNGFRVSDQEDIEEIKRLCGAIRLDIEAYLGMGFLHAPAHTAKLSIAGGNFLLAQPIGVINGVDMQFTGQVRKIDVSAINRCLDASQLVLISPVGHSLGGVTYNLPLPETAADIAIALKAEKLIFISHISGILGENEKILSNLSLNEANQYLQNYPQQPEIERIIPSVFKALEQGVRRVQIINGGKNGSLLEELFTRNGAGTSLATSFTTIRAAVERDVPDLMKLIEPMVQNGKLLPRTQDDIETHIREFFVAEYDQLIYGCAALKVFNQTIGEISCLAISDKKRGQGYGDLLLKHIENYAKEKGISQLLALTTQASDWFLERGFIPTDYNILPKERLEQYMNNKRNSLVFVKDLSI